MLFYSIIDFKLNVNGTFKQKGRRKMKGFKTGMSIYEIGESGLDTDLAMAAEQALSADDERRCQECLSLALADSINPETLIIIRESSEM